MCLLIKPNRAADRAPRKGVTQVLRRWYLSRDLGVEKDEELGASEEGEGRQVQGKR